MANIDNFVQVTVTKESASVTQQGFGTPLGLFQVSTSIIPTRLTLFTSQIEMVEAGFATADPAYLWAGAIFGQEFSPRSLYVGRTTDDGVAQVATVTITTPDAGVWSYPVDGATISYTATGSDTNLTIAQGLMNAQSLTDTNPNLDGTATIVPGGTLVSATFTVTAFRPGEAFTTGGDTLTSPGSGVGTYVTTVANTANTEAVEDALNAIIIENDEWYGLNIESRNNTDILAAAAWNSPLMKVSVLQSSETDVRDGTPANIGDQLGGFNYKRTQLFWHHKPKAFADGAMLGRALAFDLDAENGAGTWAIKQLQGVFASPLTSAQQTNAKASNADFMTTTNGRGTTNTGKSVQGEFMDVQTTLDWTASRIQEDVFGAHATTPTKIPLTNAGIAIDKAATLGVLKRGVTNAHYTPDNPLLPKVTAPDSSAISTSDRNARTLRGVVGEAQLAHAIHLTIVQVNVLT